MKKSKTATENKMGEDENLVEIGRYHGDEAYSFGLDLPIDVVGERLERLTREKRLLSIRPNLEHKELAVLGLFSEEGWILLKAEGWLDFLNMPVKLIGYDPKTGVLISQTDNVKKGGGYYLPVLYGNGKKNLEKALEDLKKGDNA